MSEVAFWFRRDLRLQDNRGLSKALELGLPVRLFFIFDPDILQFLQVEDHRVTFIWDQLAKMNQLLDQQQNSIEILYGRPQEVWPQVVQRYPRIQHIFCNHDYEPSAINRDESIKKWSQSNGIYFQSYKDQVIFEKSEVLSDKGSTYAVYTPYKKKWLSLLNGEHIKSCLVESDKLKLPLEMFKKIPKPVTLEEMGFKKSRIKPPAIYFTPELLATYSQTRDFPYLEGGTTRMGLALRFGLVSVRSCVRSALSVKADVWLSELIWREFFMQILFHYPHCEHKCFKSQYENISYRNISEEFERWKMGQTGVPLVDAGMRELAQTGHMHNRVRMMVASYLTKHLLHYWKQGERYFASQLFDFDLASNVGNWQWAAGCGVDAAPYFRVFNPELQAKKFDPQAEYIKKWVPELDSPSYPKPIIEHDVGRKRAIATYQKGLKNG